VVGRPLDDTDLVARARRGDAPAFEALVRMHQDIAFRASYLVTASAEDAEEATTAGFLKAHRALRRFQPGKPFRPWLLAIVVNEARNRRRSAARHERIGLRALAQDRAGDAAPSLEASVLAAERRRRLLDLVSELPEKQRLAIACRYFLDLDEAETALVLGVRPGTVKSRLARGLARLREELPDDA
jgi:RNA polymerase sigma-70 factor (ECF subfamily)